MGVNGDKDLLIDNIRHNAVGDSQQTRLARPINVCIEQADPVTKLRCSHSEVRGYCRFPDTTFAGSNRYDVFDCVYALTHCSFPPKSGEYSSAFHPLGHIPVAVMKRL
jgi:hypothetical protein